MNMPKSTKPDRAVAARLIRPRDSVLAGRLGACTVMTLRVYADRKQWPLGRISVRLAHNKIYAADCEGVRPARE